MLLYVNIPIVIAFLNQGWLAAVTQSPNVPWLPTVQVCYLFMPQSKRLVGGGVDALLPLAIWGLRFLLSCGPALH